MDAEFHVLNVGQGNCCLWRYGSCSIIVDANIPPAGQGTHVKSYLLKQGVSSPINLLILTGWDDDHANPDGVGMILRNFLVSEVWIPDYKQNTESADRVKDLLIESNKNKGTRILHPSTDKTRGCRVKGTKITLFSPHPDDATNSNNASIVAKLKAEDSFDSFSVLVTGDCEPSRWESILQYFTNDLASNILVAPHHGSNNGITKEAFDAINPKLTVISVGENQYGFPERKAMNIYESSSKVFTTKEHGNLKCESGFSGTRCTPKHDEDD